MSDTHDNPDLSAAAKALSDAAAQLTRALADSFQEVKPHLSTGLAAGLREAAEGLTAASDGVRAAAAKGAAERRADTAARTRADLLAAAARAIADKGYEGASMGDIAAEAGFTKGALYAHFASKEDLFAALAEQQIAADEPLPAPGGLAEALAGAIRATPDRRALLLTLEIMAFAMRNEAFRARLAPRFEEAIAHVAAQVAADAGREAPASEDRDTAIGLLALMNTARLLGAIVADPDEEAETTVRLVTRLLG
jgi:AcrR family transcriptional regulator